MKQPVSSLRQWMLEMCIRDRYGAGVPVPEAYLADYLEGLYDALVSGNGQLSASQYTAYSRSILALAAVGEDPASFAGYDLLKWLEDYDKTTKQGVTGAAYALLALDCAGDTFQSSQRKAYVQYILDAQRKDCLLYTSRCV